MSKKPLGIRTGAVRAKQIRGAPDYPVQALYPCAQGPDPYVFWMLNNLQLTEGILVRSEGFISYAPAMVTRMRIESFRVRAYIDAFHEEAVYALRLVYTAKSGEAYEQVSDGTVRAAERDEFTFDIPLEHLNQEGWFTCVLHLVPITPIPPGDERALAQQEGLENPCLPLIVRGCYLEIRG